MNISQQPCQKRQALIKARKALSNDYRQSASERICERLINSELFTDAQHIAVYIDTRAEVETNRLIKALHDSGKHCYLPTINSDKSLSFFQYDKDTVLHETDHHILEPEQHPDTNIQAPSLDVVIVPMVGFDRHCSRIGSGFGCYDRSFEFLAKKNLKKPVLVGIAYDIQELETIELNPWDVPMDHVISETACYKK